MFACVVYKEPAVSGSSAIVLITTAVLFASSPPQGSRVAPTRPRVPLAPPPAPPPPPLQIRFTFAAALLATSALAAPKPQATDVAAADPPKEIVTLTKLSGFVAADGKLETMSFSLATDDGNVGCTNKEGERPSTVSVCGETKYRFAVAGGVYTETAVNVTIYHEKGPA